MAAGRGTSRPAGGIMVAEAVRNKEYIGKRKLGGDRDGAIICVLILNPQAITAHFAEASVPLGKH